MPRSTRIYLAIIAGLAACLGLVLVGPRMRADAATPSVKVITNTVTIVADQPGSFGNFVFPSRTVTASCPDGFIATGGGVRLSGISRAGLIGYATAISPFIPIQAGSYPSGDPSQAWAADLAPGTFYFDTPGSSYRATVYAVCMQSDAATSAGVQRTSEDDTDKAQKLTDEQRQQRQRTNRSGRDDEHAEGNITAVDCTASTPTISIANRDGTVVVELQGDAAQACGTATVGAYLEADGTKQSEQRFTADSITVRKR
jgi:hypothetical protein